QISLDLLVLFESLFVIAVVTDIEPIAIKGIAHNGPTVGQETLHKVREIQVFMRLNVPQHLIVENVDAHADPEYMHRLFDIIRNTVINFMINNPEVDLEVLFICSDGNKCFVLFVKLEEVAVVEVSNDVTIHDQKVLIKLVHLG